MPEDAQVHMQQQQQQHSQQHPHIWQHFFIDKKPTPVPRPWQWTSRLRGARVPKRCADDGDVSPATKSPSLPGASHFRHRVPFFHPRLETEELVFTTENPSSQLPQTLTRRAVKIICVILDSTETAPRRNNCCREAVPQKEK
jgi:hypothetical protein